MKHYEQKEKTTPHKGENGRGTGNGYHPAVLEKEHPKGPLGTVKGHKTTRKQQALFGIARGMQKGDTSKSYSPTAAKLARGLSGKEVHKIASKPKSGFRRKSNKGESALNRVLAMVEEYETENKLEEQGRYPEVPTMNPTATDLPAHASGDAQKFRTLIARIENLEKRLRELETPRSASSPRLPEVPTMR